MLTNVMCDLAGIHKTSGSVDKIWRFIYEANKGEGLSCGYYKAAPAANVVGEYYEGSQHEFLENIISSLSKEALLPSAKSVV